MRTFDEISAETSDLRRAGSLTLERYLALEREGQAALRKEMAERGSPDYFFDELMYHIYKNDPRKWAEV